MGKNISQSEECFPFKENIFPKEEKFHSWMIKICMKVENDSHWKRNIFTNKEIFLHEWEKSDECFSLKENIFLQEGNFLHEFEKICIMWRMFPIRGEYFSPKKINFLR
jgi:hypothetical protein